MHAEKRARFSSIRGFTPRHTWITCPVVRRQELLKREHLLQDQHDHRLRPPSWVVVLLGSRFGWRASAAAPLVRVRWPGPDGADSNEPSANHTIPRLRDSTEAELRPRLLPKKGIRVTFPKPARAN